MRIATFFLIISLFPSKGPTTLTGVVSVDNYPLSGCKIEVLENGTNQLTDSDGKFRLVVDNLDELTLTISYVDRLTCKVVIQDIKIHGTEIDLGAIPLFFNETISISDYSKLSSNKKEMYDEMQHWTKLIGYINKNQADTAAMRATLWTNRKIKYRFDSLNNKVVVNYKDWNR